ncbi:MAG: hypothetical protein O2856_15315 [Planctomycetota bacterium]|nr:hypothetical protein [Planctomycetota bacterium]
MARDATARLYDVDAQSVVFNRLKLTDRYDQATITFRAKKDKLIDLEQLHESVWATRLSGGTSSGVVCLKITAVGHVTTNADKTVLNIDGADQQFVLTDDVAAKPADAEKTTFTELRKSLADGQHVVNVTGYVEGWAGRWPAVLSKPPATRPKLMVISFETAPDE